MASPCLRAGQRDSQRFSHGMGQILLQLWSCMPSGAGRIRRRSPDVGKRPLEETRPREKTQHEFLPPNFPSSFLKVIPELQQLQWLGKGFPWRAGRMFWRRTGGVQVLCVDWRHPGLGTRDVRAAGARLDFLVVLELMLSAAQMRRLYFLTPTSVFTSLYLLELKGLFH